ncbi:MAG TPA: hypothetical protein VGK67_02575 [Myxococcales bacterium]|jgi:hypothetical protein
MASNLNPQQQGWLDRLVNLFRSKPPEQAAAELERMLDPAGGPADSEKPKADDLSEPVTRYKGVTF